MNKLARINTNATAVNSLIHMPEVWNLKWTVFYNHVTNYSAIGKNAHDDAPDTLTEWWNGLRVVGKGLILGRCQGYRVRFGRLFVIRIE